MLSCFLIVVPLPVPSGFLQLQNMSSIRKAPVRVSVTLARSGVSTHGVLRCCESYKVFIKNKKEEGLYSVIFGNDRFPRHSFFILARSYLVISA
jgi:hypothetical protein